MKVQMPGVHKVNAKLADGTRRAYYYAWRGGPRMVTEPGSKAFMGEYLRLTRNRLDVDLIVSGSIAELIKKYRMSADWLTLKQSTRDGYEYAIDKIEAQFGTFPLSGLDQPGIRTMFLEWRDDMAVDHARSADATMDFLKRILAFGLDRELIRAHPLLKVKKIANSTRRDVIWSEDDMDRFKASAPDYLVMALMLAAWTGQRQGDLLRLQWNAYDGHSIMIRQSKGGAIVRPKVSADLKTYLDAAPRTSTRILVNARGLPWKTGFRSSWRKAMAAAGITGKTFHDLRGTFVTLAHRNGSSIKEIAEITGHSEKDAEKIIKKHYLVSSAAVESIENRKR